MNNKPTIEQRLEKLEQLVILTRLPGEAIVGADYVASLFNCSTNAVVRGRFDTDKIPRVRERPVGFRKMDVHRVLREVTKPVAEKANGFRSKGSLIKRK